MNIYQNFIKLHLYYIIINLPINNKKKRVFTILSAVVQTQEK